MKIALILLAGGQSTRMGGLIPKTFMPLKGRPVIRYSFDLLSPLFPTVVVSPETYRPLFPPNTLLAPPGARRQDSVKNGFDTLGDQFDFILIHDGARPLIRQCDIERLIDLGRHHPAAALASPVTNTLKRVLDKTTETVNRDNLFEVYTPQLVRANLLKEGLALNITVTDDISLVETLGHRPLLVPSSYPNIKLTYPSDIPLIEALL